MQIVSIQQGKRCLTRFTDYSDKMFSKKALIHLIWPLVVEQFLAVTIGLSDTIMVSSVGEAAVSGISIVDSINVLLIQVFSALATGGAVVASQYIGSRNRKSACVAAKQLFYAITVLASGIMVVCLMYHSAILRLVYGNIDADVMRNADVYFRLTAISYPFLAIYNAGAALFRSMGNSKISMFVSLIDNIIHIGGNAVLIYGCGWGSAGAGTATLAARILAALAMFLLICNPNNLIFVEHPFRFDVKLDMIRRILHIGVPNGFENGMFQIGKLIVQRLVTTLGTSAIAANAVANSISNLSNIPGNAIGLAMITVVGQCVGAGDYDQSVFYTRRLMTASYFLMGLLNVALIFTSHPLVGVYNLDPAASASAVRILRIFALCNATIWVPSFTLPNALRAAGDVRFTMLTSMISMWVFRIGFSYIFVGALRFGVLGVWCAMFVDWSVRMVVFILRFRSGKWKRKRVI